MAHIEYSNLAHENVLCINACEARALSGFIRKAAATEFHRYQKYADIHEAGEATEHQTDLMIKHEENFDMIRGIAQLIEELVYPF